MANRLPARSVPTGSSPQASSSVSTKVAPCLFEQGIVLIIVVLAKFSYGSLVLCEYYCARSRQDATLTGESVNQIVNQSIK